MFIPEQEVLILENITCEDDLCQFIGYIVHDKELKVFYFHNIKDINSSPKTRKTNFDKYKHILDKNMNDFFRNYYKKDGSR